MENPASLSLEQKFNIEKIRREAAQSHEIAIAYCIYLFVRLTYMDAGYKRAIAENWGLNQGVSGSSPDSATGNTFSPRNVDCSDLGHSQD